MKSFNTTFQIGKNGLTEGVLNSLKQDLKSHRQVRVTVLKSCCRNKEELKKLADKIENSIPIKLKVRTLGYTIILVKLSNRQSL